MKILISKTGRNVGTSCCIKVLVSKKFIVFFVYWCSYVTETFVQLYLAVFILLNVFQTEHFTEVLLF